MLSVKEASVYFGKVSGIRDVSIDVEEGQIVALIGANGAGKSTTLRAISGLKQPSSGEIWFKGERIDDLSPEEITMRGIAHVPEGRRVFPYMTVKENLEMGAFSRKDKAGIARDLEGVFRHFPRLRERLTQAAGTMSGGEQQMLAMGRALMSDPTVVLMDEPSLGLSPILCQEIAKIIKEIHAEGRTVVLVEQNARLALSLAQKGYVLETGSVVLEDDAKALLENDKVRETYLGGSD
ncbi:MAG: ABC transporter ATP-binding protein [Alphaproteobacteria bacterium]|nr:ABC transporter ATP-binding protein [Rhodospirillales bacterium]MBT4019742.1 ABC transporter ATP-binding protein [Alphaproteobacteria bacterium]MBT4463134.1 ABC transporter ATP-binding protein [Rhodospirillaceae bacterium]